jgi:hypothetical protein
VDAHSAASGFDSFCARSSSHCWSRFFCTPAPDIGNAAFAVIVPPGATLFSVFFLPAFVGSAATLPLRWR